MRERGANVGAAEGVGVNKLPRAVGLGAKAPGVDALGRDLPEHRDGLAGGNVVVDGHVLVDRVAVVIDLAGVNRGGQRFVAHVADKRHRDVVGCLANPVLGDRVVLVGNVGEDGSHGRRRVAVVAHDDRVARVFRAGRVVVVLNRRHKVALKVILQDDAGIDRVGVVGQAALFLGSLVRADFLHDVGKATCGAAVLVHDLGLVRQVGQDVVDGREVAEVVGLLVVGVEALGHLLGKVRGRNVVVNLVARHGGGALLRVDHVVGRVRVEGIACCHRMRRQIEALIVGAGAADLGHDVGVAVVPHVALPGANRDRLLAAQVVVMAQVLSHRVVADGLERELEAPDVRGQRLVPAGALDILPRGALEALGGLDRGRALGVVGIGKDGQRRAGAAGHAILDRVVHDARRDRAVFVLDGLDADVGKVARVGDALVGVDVVLVRRGANVGPSDVGGDHLVELAQGVACALDRKDGAVGIGKVGHATVGVGAALARLNACGQRPLVVGHDVVKLCLGVLRAREHRVLIGHDLAQGKPDGGGAIGDFVLIRGLGIGVRARDAIGQGVCGLVVELGQGARGILLFAVIPDLVRNDRRRAVVYALVGVVRRNRGGGRGEGDAHLCQVGSAHGRDLRHRELLGLFGYRAHVEGRLRGSANGIERARRKRHRRRIGLVAVHIDVRILNRARAIARNAIGQRGVHGVELRLGVVGVGAVLVRAGRADAGHAHGQLVVREAIELSHRVAGNRAVADAATQVLVVVVLDGLMDGVVEVPLPDAGGRVLDEVFLRDADRAKVNATLAVGERSRVRRGLGDGRGGCLAVVVADFVAGRDQARHRHLRDIGRGRARDVLDVNRVVVGVDSGRLLNGREDKGELILFFVGRAIEALVQPAAAREILHGLDHGAAARLVLARVGHREGQSVAGVVGRGLVALQHVMDVLRRQRLKLVDVDQGAVLFEAREAMLDHAVGVLVALRVIHRQAFEGQRVDAIGRRTLVDRRARGGDAHPARGLILRDLAVALLQDLLRLRQVGPRRAIQHQVGVLVGLAFPDLLHGNGHELGVGEARLGNLGGIVGEARDIDPRRIDAVVGARDVRAHALGRKLDLHVEAAFARVDNHDARVLG